MKKLNEQGNALLTVLLVSIVFTTIGLAIVASSISGAKRVETRESDITITFESKKVLDEITSTIATRLNTLNLDMVKNSDGTYRVNSSFQGELQNNVLIPSLNDIVNNTAYNASIKCLSIKDISNNDVVYLQPNTAETACAASTEEKNTSSYSINRNYDYTRVLEIVLVTNNPNENEGDVTRTLKKKIILSPLPSFLKYAAGSASEDKNSGLFLNGSSNINGNAFANYLTISKDANYQDRAGKSRTVASLPPSVNGDFYSTGAAILEKLKEDNFYKKDVPDLKHDSQFINIEYDQTLRDRINTMLSNNALTTTVSTTTDVTNLSAVLSKEISSKVTAKTAQTDIVKTDTQQVPQSVVGDSLEKLENGFTIDSKTGPVTFTENVQINGDVVINSSNYPITFEKDLIVNGNLYIVSNKNISLQSVKTAGDLHLINFGGNVTAWADLVAAGKIVIESDADTTTSSVSNGVKLNGDIFAGKTLSIRPLNTEMDLNSNIISLGAFTVKGDEKGEADGENDIVRFNSVVYSNAESFISNVNIIGLPYTNKLNKSEEGQLILLSKDRLTITRMNEFNNYSDMNEPSYPYLPIEEKNIQPLKAFFYTEKDAELYGVGSLFYIKGGIFAKNSLEINAIRANRAVKNIENVPLSSEDYMSRFIVDYDQDVLLKGIDALPIVDRLQIIPDDFIIQ